MTTPQPAALPELIRMGYAESGDNPDDWRWQLAHEAERLATLQPKPAAVSDDELRKAIDALRDPETVSAFYNGYYTLTSDELRRAILALRPAAQTDEQTIVEICERIGFGRVQQIAGHAWEQRHNCAPRGRMGVTVRNEKPAPQQATPEPVGGH